MKIKILLNIFGGICHALNFELFETNFIEKFQFFLQKQKEVLNIHIHFIKFNIKICKIFYFNKK